MYKRKFNLLKILIKWVFVGILPWVLFLALWSVKKHEIIEWVPLVKASIVFSFVPYFGLPHFFKLLKELWELWKEGDWVLKIFLPMGMLGVVGRVIWMIINDPNFKK